MTEIRVKVSRDLDHWRVDVCLPDGSRYATVRSEDMELSLKMALPYIAYAVEPHPFADLIGDK